MSSDGGIQVQAHLFASLFSSTIQSVVHWKLLHLEAPTRNFGIDPLEVERAKEGGSLWERVKVSLKEEYPGIVRVGGDSRRSKGVLTKEKDNSHRGEG